MRYSGALTQCRVPRTEHSRLSPCRPTTSPWNPIQGSYTSCQILCHDYLRLSISNRLLSRPSHPFVGTYQTTPICKHQTIPDFPDRLESLEAVRNDEELFSMNSVSVSATPVFMSVYQEKHRLARTVEYKLYTRYIRNPSALLRGEIKAITSHLRYIAG